MLKSSRPIEGVMAVSEAWGSVCPTKVFFGRTLGQYREETKPVFDLRTQIAEARRRLKSLIAQRNDADAAAMKLTRHIVHSVKADPTEGENSPLYAAMGYVRPSERSSGLMRPVVAVSDTEEEGEADVTGS